MLELREKFQEFFFELWGHTPFQWQSDLVERVLTNAEAPWPEAIALPTASGKTACIDIAVFSLALQADQLAPGKPLSMPRRIFFVVDRRIIVDEAFDRASKLAEKLRTAKDGILKEVANRLLTISGTSTPLICYELRGGMYRSDAWSHSPTQPAVIASTVDQFGSRLLFRGYGRSSRAWPIQAGLTGNDVLVLLDEAHCAQPFMETTKGVQRYRQWGDRVPLAPFYVVVMSATPPDGLKDVFRDNSEEPRIKGHPLGDRQLASKPMEIVQPTETEIKLTAEIKIALKEYKEAEKKGIDIQRRYRKKLGELRQKAADLLAAGMAKKAEELVRGRPLAAVIFANRVATARRIYALLSQKFGNNTLLLTGRMRSIDKDDAIRQRLSILSASASKDRRLESPMFVVATQTLEVGADLDFDLLVTECAPMDALRQRFGRLNRMGREIAAAAAVLVRADQSAKSEDDPVYGSALAETWKWILKKASKKGIFDMGISALSETLTIDLEVEKLNTPSSHAPVMQPAHLDCLVQTWPEPVPSPDVSIFLHGPGNATGDVQICWRSDLPQNRKDIWLDILSYCPPATPECLPVPIYVFRQWFCGEVTALEEQADVEGVPAPDEQTGQGQFSVVRWRGRNDAEVVSDPMQIFPGDVIVIPAEQGGWDVLGDLPQAMSGKPVLDWGDRANRLARAKAVLRLHTNAFADLQLSSKLRGLIGDAEVRLNDDPALLAEELRNELKTLAAELIEPEWAWLREIALNLSTDKRLARGLILHPAGGLIILGTRRLPSIFSETDSFSDEDDATACGGIRHIPLSVHMDGVGRYSKRFAESCGLSEQLVNAVEIAGRTHDLGKADPRFQSWLKGGNPWTGGPLLAKSEELPQGRKENERARERSGYPKGGRHELLSVSLMDRAANSPLIEDSIHDLVLHLVASHHGFCRPFAPVVSDQEPINVTVDFEGQSLSNLSATGLERADSGIAERFWRLVRCHGWWGLAYLEAIFRLADHRCSEAEQDSGGAD